MNLDQAERKLKALQRLVRAQETGLMSSPVIVTTDAAGATPAGAERILNREMAARGLEPHDLEEAGLEVQHVNLHWAAGRNLRFGDKAAGLADDDGQDIIGATGRFYDPSVIAESGASDYQSEGLSGQNPSPEQHPAGSTTEGDDLAPRMLPDESRG